MAQTGDALLRPGQAQAMAQQRNIEHAKGRQAKEQRVPHRSYHVERSLGSGVPLAGHDVVVLGVSPDSPESHTKFRDEFDLPFTLLSDPERKVLGKYGAWAEKSMYGKKTMGVIRSTFLIDCEGRIAFVWPNVKAKGHVAKVLEKIDELL